MTRRKVAVALNSSSFFSFVDCRALSWTSKMRKKKKKEKLLLVSQNQPKTGPVIVSLS